MAKQHKLSFRKKRSEIKEEEEFFFKARELIFEYIKINCCKVKKKGKIWVIYYHALPGIGFKLVVFKRKANNILKKNY